jgi:3-hydroxyacyl-[acyl-carrier-protein] dehydratase
MTNVVGSDSAALFQMLPHRPPFLFVSRVREIQPGQEGHAEWTITGDEDFLRGHFPERPIVPGVLIVEALAQVAGLVGFSSRDADGRTGGRLAHADVRFDHSVEPPAIIQLHARLERSIARLHRFAVQAQVDGQPIARGSLALAEVVGP